MSLILLRNTYCDQHPFARSVADFDFRCYCLRHLAVSARYPTAFLINVKDQTKRHRINRLCLVKFHFGEMVLARM